MHERGQRRQRSPRDHGRRDHPARAPAFHQQGARNLQGHIADEENARSQSKHAVAESEVARHADRGIRHAGAVQIIGDVKDEKKWQQPHRQCGAACGPQAEPQRARSRVGELRPVRCLRRMVFGTGGVYRNPRQLGNWLRPRTEGAPRLALFETWDRATFCVSTETPGNPLFPFAGLGIYNLRVMKNRSYFLRTDSRLNSCFRLLLFPTCMLVTFAVTPGRALATQTVPSAAPGVYTPAADPKAIVIAGHARFTVLTPQLIRMEWAADGKFEDHASLVFLNRRAAGAEVHRERRRGNGSVAIKTDALELELSARLRTATASSPLTISRSRSPSTASRSMWHPGMPDTGNLRARRAPSTTHSAARRKSRSSRAWSRAMAGPWWTTRRGRCSTPTDFSFVNGENSPWPWVMQRPAGDRQDWYFFGYGHDYKQALADFTKVAGPIPLPPRFAFGAWWSRYWAYSDQELDDLVHGFRNNDVPLDVLVIDMDWHLTFGPSWHSPSRSTSPDTPRAGAATPGTSLLFPDPDTVPEEPAR